jgi:phosphatidylserine decarboxylase
MRSNLLPIAKEGFKYIFYAFLMTIVFSILDLEFLELLSFLFLIFFTFIYRNPERENILYQEDSVVCPIDGKVIAIDEFKDNSKYSYKITIDNTYLDTSLLRMPFNGSVSFIRTEKGARVSSKSSLFSEINENSEIIFKDTNKNELKIIHTLKQSITPIDINIIYNQKLLQGSRYGIMVNGITNIYLPQNFRINLSVDSQVIASQTLVGYFTR